jgi:uncharacterized RmlC-like cupin family protein
MAAYLKTHASLIGSLTRSLLLYLPVFLSHQNFNFSCSALVNYLYRSDNNAQEGWADVPRGRRG